jgi:hypothetical protein
MVVSLLLKFLKKFKKGWSSFKFLSKKIIIEGCIQDLGKYMKDA